MKNIFIKIKKVVEVITPELVILRKMRTSIQVKDSNRSIPKDLTFTIATTKEELISALSLVQKNYEEINILEQSEYRKLRLTRYNMLPTTIIFISKWKGQVIGTISLIIDSKFGVPMDEMMDLSSERKENLRFGEISALAINNKYSSINGVRILYYLINIVFKYAAIIKMDKTIYVTHPKAKILYSALIAAKPYNKKISEYESLKNAPAYCQYTDIKNLTRNLKEDFHSLKNSESFLELHTRSNKENHYLLGSVEKKLTNHTFYDVETFKSTFLSDNNFLEELKLKDYKILKEIYSSSKIRETINNILILPSIMINREDRIPIFLDGILKKAESINMDRPVKIWNFSLDGLLISLNNKEININDKYSLLIFLPDSKQVILNIICRHIVRGSSIRYGIQILGTIHSDWHDFNANYKDSQDDERIVS